MVSIVKRMTKLRALLAIRIGPGAAVLPSTVSKIHMEFAVRMKDGHLGPRKFWRQCLPRLKYHNPAVSMTVERNTNQEGPALMTVHFNDAAPAATLTPASTEAASAKDEGRVVTLNMKHRHESEILSQLLALTTAVHVTPTPEELEMLDVLEKAQQKSESDRIKNLAFNEAKKRKEAILAAARAGVAA